MWGSCSSMYSSLLHYQDWICIPKIYTQYVYTCKYVLLLGSAQAGKIPALMQDTSATSCSPLAIQGKAHYCKWMCTKHKWKIWISVLITGPLEFGKYLVQGHGGCLSPAALFHALILRFPLPAHAHKHTEGSPRNWLQSLLSDFHCVCSQQLLVPQVSGSP